MNKQELLSSLDELLEVASGTLKGPEPLASIEGWNSLAVIDFMAMVDERLGVRLKPSKIGECGTVDDLIGLLGERVS
jgi:acyl carrier protein